MTKRSLWMLLAVLGLVIVPIWLGGEFTGADGQAAQMIEETRPDFAPWFTPLWKPPSAEIESMLFSLQAALGALVIGYVVGRRHGRQIERRDAAKPAKGA